MKQSEVEVFPYVGVNDYKFGKTPSEIEKECGAPQKREEDDILEMVIEDRDGMEFEYHKKGKKYLLSAITILQKNCKNIYLDGKNIFDSMSLGVSDLSSNYLQGEKYVFYGDVGVSVAGYSRKKPKEGPYVIAFNQASYSIFELDGLKK